MGGFFGVVSKSDCVSDLFFGTDYHSHLGTRRAGMAVCNGKNFNRAIHNIENSPFRTKFENDLNDMEGLSGIGCISDSEPQPLIIRSHLGTYAITTVGRINNEQELVERAFGDNRMHFLEMSSGNINSTELVAALINQRASIVEGIRYAQSLIDGSMSMLILTKEGMYAARDRMGRTPVVIGEKDGARCATLESFAYFNLGYKTLRELGPAEIVFITPESVKTVAPPQKDMKICAFLWVYFGYPPSVYEGVNVEEMRYRCGQNLAARDVGIEADCVAGVPDSGTPHAIGYAHKAGIPFARPFIKYTPTWPRSFMPKDQSMRSLVAKMKLLPVENLIRDKDMVLIDDSIVRGTQLRETAEFLYDTGAKSVHVRTACPPILFGCKYINFSRSTNDLELITRRTILELEGKADNETAKEYAVTGSEKYNCMVDCICKKLNFTSLKYNTQEDMLDAIGIDKDCVCTYCFNGKE